ncbi:MAG TPA: F0F1 ATP synthase subunit epsilon [Actinomycetota bacterium]|nr:F0F1 ATP synthase subunit epsilon [Actinomycetota bacterium]
MPASFEVSLVTPEREVWSGRATLVVARGTEGEVGIMAGHAPMLLQLAISALHIRTEDGGRVAAAVDGGFLHVTTSGGRTRVDVLGEYAELEHEIDVERERRRKEDAERRIMERDDAEAQAELAKAITRLSLRA